MAEQIRDLAEADPDRPAIIEIRPGTGGDALFPEASSAPPTIDPPAENSPR